MKQVSPKEVEHELISLDYGYDHSLKRWKHKIGEAFVSDDYLQRHPVEVYRIWVLGENPRGVLD